MFSHLVSDVNYLSETSRVGKAFQVLSPKPNLSYPVGSILFRKVFLCLSWTSCQVMLSEGNPVAVKDGTDEDIYSFCLNVTPRLESWSENLWISKANAKGGHHCDYHCLSNSHYSQRSSPQQYHSVPGMFQKVRRKRCPPPEASYCF